MGKISPSYTENPNLFLNGHKINDRTDTEVDSQRSKLYNAEFRVSKGKSFNSLSKCQAYVNKLLGYKWFQRRFGKRVCYLKMGQRNCASYCNTQGTLIRITLSPDHWFQRPILHELAHGIVEKPHAWHGRLFAKVYLDLVQWQLGKEIANIMKENYREYNVKWHAHQSLKRQ